MSKPLVGFEGNAWNNAATGAGGVSNAVDCQGSHTVTAFGHVSGATTLTVQFSQNGTTFYDTATTTAPVGAADFALSFSTGARWVRVKSSGAVTATATIAGKG